MVNVMSILNEVAKMATANKVNELKLKIQLVRPIGVFVLGIIP